MKPSAKQEVNGKTAGLKKIIPKRNLVFRKLIDYKYALDQSAIVAITDQKGIIQHVNRNFCEISKYPKKELIGQDHRIINSGYHSVSYIKNMWSTIARGKIWRGEFRNKKKDGSFYWVDTVIIPFLNEGKKPYQYLSIRNDITDKKKLQAELLEQQKNEQLKIATKTLEAQEKERHAIGIELHDNINQLLTGTKLTLSMIRDANQETQKLVATSMEYLQNAIDENRKIAHKLVTPNFNKRNLTDQIKAITNCMLKTIGIEVHIDFTGLQEELINDQERLTVYRIVQEQCTNIVKHSLATKVDITMKTERSTLFLTITDNGKGMEKDKEAHGIGLENINSRLSILNGASYVNSEAGKGFSLHVEIPVKGMQL